MANLDMWCSAPPQDVKREQSPAPRPDHRGATSIPALYAESCSSFKDATRKVQKRHGSWPETEHRHHGNWEGSPRHLRNFDSPSPADSSTTLEWSASQLATTSYRL